VFAADARLSADGKRIAATVIDTNGAGDVWVYDLARESSQRLTVLPFDEKSPVWAADGNSVYYRTDGAGPPDIAQWRLGEDHGSLIYRGPAVEEPHDVSPDGKSLLYIVEASTGADIRVLPLSPPGPPRDLIATPFDEREPRFSPDGKFVAYSSDVSGQPEVYVRPFEGGGGEVRVSKDGGTRPRWSRDGSEIFFLAPDSRVFAAPVTNGVPAVTSPLSLLTSSTWSKDTSPPASPELWPSTAMMAPGSTRNWRPEA
jgi:Tol biopolymer transport system component